MQSLKTDVAIKRDCNATIETNSLSHVTSFDDYGYFDMEQLMELKLIERRDSKKTGGYKQVR